MMMYDYYGNPRRHGPPQTMEGQGSGVIIDKDGHILTSHHVIQQADEISVTLLDGTEFQAVPVGDDPLTDISVLKIKDLNGYDLSPIQPGDSDALRIGEMVVAIGSPFSLSSSVTLGIVSQKDRSVGVLPYENFIQTDASINPGNSGGPLVDLDGRMVGLNALIQTAGDQGSIGIGFAVPADRAFSIAKVLISGKAVERPWLGIYPEQMRPSAARYLLDRDGAVVIHTVFRDTPAYKAGLFRGDIVLAVDDVEVFSILDLQREVFRHTIGDPITLEVLRTNRKIKIEVVSEMMPDPRQFE
jgi:serine protease Do